MFGREKFTERFVHAGNGNGESNALTFAINGHVNPNQVAIQVDQGAAAVARIDGRIGLKPVGHVQDLVRLGHLPIAAAENTAADRASQSEGVAKRNHCFAQ